MPPKTRRHPDKYWIKKKGVHFLLSSSDNVEKTSNSNGNRVINNNPNKQLSPNQLAVNKHINA